MIINVCSCTYNWFKNLTALMYLITFFIVYCCILSAKSLCTVGYVYWLIYFKDILITNTIFIRLFWHLKVTQPFLWFWANQVYVFLSQHYMFASSTHWVLISSPVGFAVSAVENLLLGLIPERFFWNLAFSLLSRAFPTRILRQGVTTLLGCSVVLYPAPYENIL